MISRYDLNKNSIRATLERLHFTR